ncbi:MAG TPA: hypothetical protein VN253_01785 [Kofleriaceae bacterium]|nr:hypothetical protein [Kofleriaceae bacterium]
MSTDGDRVYKRKWRNLLLNKSYQLRFTLFMVGLSTVLMVGLGFWVMTVANETTKVSRTSVMGTPCPPVPELPEAIDPSAEPGAAPAPAPSAPTPAPGDGSGGSAAGTGSASAAGSGGGSAADDDARRKGIVVDLDPMEMAKPPPPKARVLPADYALAVAKHWTCELKIDAAIEGLDRGRLRILWVLIGTGLILVLGLAAYGIKTTHKVAGPLFKVGLYLKKMRDGRFDKVYNLRKGDQLVEFYDHFKNAHAGVVKMQQADVERLRAVIAAAEAAGASADPAVGELRELLARKEKSIE